MPPTATDIERALTLLRRATPEQAVCRDLEEALALGGWDWLRLVDSRGQHAVGFPDYFAWHRGRGVVALEAKREGGRLSKDQQRVLGDLRAAGVPTLVVKPSNLDEIRSMLLGRNTK